MERQELTREQRASMKLARKFTSGVLYFSGVLFIVAAILLFSYPEKAEAMIGLDAVTARLLAGAIAVAGIADFFVAKFVFGKSERV